MLVSESFAFRRDIGPANDRLTLLTDRGPQTFPVAGVYYDYSTDQGAVLMDATVYRAWYDDPWISSAALFLEAGASPDALLNRLREETLVGKNLLARANSELRADVFELFERTFLITGALQLLATGVAFIGILSALLALQLEHTRQYGVLRACGMSPAQLWRYTLLQTGLMGATAGALSLPVGMLVALVLVTVVNLRSFGWALELTLAAGEPGDGRCGGAGGGAAGGGLPGLAPGTPGHGAGAAQRVSPGDGEDLALEKPAKGRHVEGQAAQQRQR